MARGIKNLTVGYDRACVSGRTVSAGLAGGLIELAVAQGADREELLRRASIRQANLLDQDERIAYESYVELMRAARDLSGDPALALHYGSAVHMSEFSVAGLLFQACETVLESITHINRYGELVIETDKPGPKRFEWVRKGSKLWLVDTRRNPNHFPELTEATFARFIGMTRRFWDKPLVEEVHVTHSSPAYAAEYDRVFAARTVFSADWNAMAVDETRITDPIRQQPRYSFGILSKHAEELLRSLERTETTRAHVETLLMPTLHTGIACIGSTAAKMGLSRQTLYRRLRDEGVTFEQVLDNLRHRLALDYLRDAKVSINEIAFLVGFSDAASFSRAFKRWTGMRPRTARAQLNAS